jgi:DNA-binding PadR family transcriptional regulator
MTHEATPPFNLYWRFAKGRGQRRHHDPEGGPMFRFRGGPGPFFFGVPPFGGRHGQRKRRGDVRIALLLLLAEESRNGYQLMQTIEQRSEGQWRPSPGSVYPALQQLEDEGLVRAIERDGAKLFEITDAGRQVVAERGDEPAPWEADDDDAAETAADLRNWIRQIAIAVMQVHQAGDEQQIERASQLLAETRRALYRILAEDSEPSA